MLAFLLVVCLWVGPVFLAGTLLASFVLAIVDCSGRGHVRIIECQSVSLFLGQLVLDILLESIVKTSLQGVFSPLESECLLPEF